MNYDPERMYYLNILTAVFDAAKLFLAIIANETNYDKHFQKKYIMNIFSYYFLNK